MDKLVPAISVQELSFSYKGNEVLHKVNIDIDQHKLTFVLGKNGSGKSTFLKLVAGLIPKQQGEINTFGTNFTQLPIAERAKLVGFLNQQHKAIFPFTVTDVVLTGRAAYIRYLPNSSDLKEAEQAMEKVGIFHLRNRNYAELSGGEQQMVMIARLLAQKPKMLLLDEPTSHLDLVNQSHLLNLLKNLVAEEITIVCVMHDPNLAFLFGDDFLFVREKTIVRNTEKAWEKDFLKTIYHNNLETIPFNGKALVIPNFN